MKYVCKICKFIHEDDLPDGYICPLCRAGRHEFELVMSDEKKCCIDSSDQCDK